MGMEKLRDCFTSDSSFALIHLCLVALLDTLVLSLHYHNTEVEAKGEYIWPSESLEIFAEIPAPIHSSPFFRRQAGLVILYGWGNGYQNPHIGFSFQAMRFGYFRDQNIASSSGNSLIIIGQKLSVAFEHSNAHLSLYVVGVKG